MVHEAKACIGHEAANGIIAVMMILNSAIISMEL